jgi:hypothetical protein
MRQAALSAPRAASAATASRASTIRTKNSSARASRFMQLESEKAQNELDIPRLKKLGDQASDNATANHLYARPPTDRHRSASMDAPDSGDWRLAIHDLQQEVKKVGPDLKEVRMKLAQGMDSLLAGPYAHVPPTTKMPQFRLSAGRNSGHRRFHLAVRSHRPAAAEANSGRRGARQDAASNLAAAWPAIPSAKARI